MNTFSGPPVRIWQLVLGFRLALMLGFARPLGFGLALAFGVGHMWALAFNQWRVTAEHRPLGEIMDVRRIYTASAKVRRTLNHQPQIEPTSASAVLP